MSDHYIVFVVKGAIVENHLEVRGTAREQFEGLTADNVYRLYSSELSIIADSFERFVRLVRDSQEESPEATRILIDTLQAMRNLDIAMARTCGRQVSLVKDIFDVGWVE